MLNRVVLIGRLATDPELKYTPSGIAVATFRLAVSRNVSNAQGEREADFIPIVTWRQAAEFAATYLTKGRLVAIDGRLQIRSWVAQDGSRRSTAEVVAEKLRSLDRPKERTEAGVAEIEEAPVVEESDTAIEPQEEEFEDPFADE
ncbi:MAG: single-stranded DNA-binding protein [Armatimonadetes bacterium]|nr:single-stranded DNA-binding protein [Armatimonadota bacterium]